jgi:predicted Zn-dependent protease
LSLVAILVAWELGKRDDTVFLNDSNLYSQAQNNMNNGNFSEAEPIVLNLLGKYPDNAILLNNYGMCLTFTGKYDSALNTLNKARAKRPFFVNNPTFLITYAQNLYMLGQYSEAQKYLLRSKQFNSSPMLITEVDKLLADISLKTNQVK